MGIERLIEKYTDKIKTVNRCIAQYDMSIESGEIAELVGYDEMLCEIRETYDRFLMDLRSLKKLF